MLTSKYMESRFNKIIDFSELNEKCLSNENIETKNKKRKSKNTINAKIKRGLKKRNIRIRKW